MRPSHRAIGLLILLASILAPFMSVVPSRSGLAQAGGGTIERVSIASDGTQGNDASYSPVAISADGRYVTFNSSASNLVPEDTNNARDLFIHDGQTGQTTRVSVASDGTQANDWSNSSAISADGRYAAFDSEASNLVMGDTNGTWDVFVHDRQTGQTTRVSVASDGSQANNSSGGPTISADGRYIAFQSRASNLVTGDSNSDPDVFVHDRQTGQTTRVSVASDGSQAPLSSGSQSISANGRYVVFTSRNRFVPEDTNSEDDVFIHDRQTGQTTMVSVTSDGSQGEVSNGVHHRPAVSADGRYVAFTSHAALVVEDTNLLNDVFVHDRQTGQTTRVSIASDGTQANNYSYGLAMSADGRYVTFQSSAWNLVPEDNGVAGDIFVHDRQTGQTTRVSDASDGSPGNDDSVEPAISADGRFVAFSSYASNLILNDTNGKADIFVHDRGSGPHPPMLDSHRITNLGTLPGFELSWATGINNQGDVVGYVEDVPNGTASQAFIWSPDGGMQALPGNTSSFATDVNDAGQVVGVLGRPHTGPFEGVVWDTDGQITDLGVLPGMTNTLPSAINQSGQAVGVSFVPIDQAPSGVPTGRAFSWTEEDGMIDMGPADDPTAFSWANDVNVYGQAVGYAYRDDFGPQYAFSWQGGVMSDISSPDWITSEATAINDAGQIVIRQTNPDFSGATLVWESSDGTILGYPSNSGDAINSSGAVVGSVFGIDGADATLWDPEGGLVHLDDLLPDNSAWHLMYAFDINDHGQIVGLGEFNGMLRAFLLEPVPTEPDLEVFELVGRPSTGGPPSDVICADEWWAVDAYIRNNGSQPSGEFLSWFDISGDLTFTGIPSPTPSINPGETYPSSISISPLSAGSAITVTFTLEDDRQDTNNTRSATYSVEDCKRPIIFIPGILGTQLEAKIEPGDSASVTFDKLDGGKRTETFENGDTIWSNEEKLFSLDKEYFGALQLYDVENNAIANPFVPSPTDPLVCVITQILFVFVESGYCNTVHFFVEEGQYVPGKDFFVFGYDWRNDVRSAIPELDDFIQYALEVSGATSVDIVAHSMGTQVARAYLTDSDVLHRSNVEHAVLLGAPNLGTPKGSWTAIEDAGCTALVRLDFLCYLVTPQVMQHISRTFPGALQLGVSDAYCEIYDGSDFQHPDPYFNQSQASGCEELQALLEQDGAVQVGLDAAEDFHADDLTWLDTVSQDVNVSLIAGVGHCTLGQIKRTTYLPFFGPPETVLDYGEVDGDGTVVRGSATLADGAYVGDAALYYRHTDHLGLANDPDVLQDVLTILDGRTPLGDAIASPWLCKAVSVHSPMELQITDSNGRVLGGPGAESVSFEIPDAGYSRFDDMKIVTFEGEDQYTINLFGTADGEATIRLRTFTQDGLIRETNFFHVPTTSTSRGTLTFDTATDAVSDLSIDLYGDGSEMISISPTILTGAAASDDVPPTTTVSLDPQMPDTGWYATSPTVTLSASDNTGGSGVGTTYYLISDANGDPDDYSGLTEYTGQFEIPGDCRCTITYFSEDRRGNIEDPQQLAVWIDGGAPTAPTAVISGEEVTVGETTWYRDQVTVDYTGSVDPNLGDGSPGSGVAGYSPSQTFNTTGAFTYSGQAEDVAGNISEAVTGTVSVDATPPTITITSPTATSYILNQPVTASFSCDDAGSEVASCVGTTGDGELLDTSTVGTKTFTVTATDNVGHSTETTIAYQVIYDFTGFFAPVSNPPSVNAVKAGSSIPVKFSLADDQGLAIFAGDPVSQEVACDASAPIGAIEVTETAGASGWSYDAVEDQYTYVWKTDKIWAGTCRQLLVTLSDGTQHTALFAFTK